MEVNSHKTNPLSKDTDADGLADGVEVNTYRTNPRNADSDNDGLRDGDEVNVYYTDPNNRDTDADGLLDGDEVRRYNTNPRDADTDKGTLRDGDEIARKKNPLDPADDIDRPMPRLELGKKVVMQGIMFETGKATILPESETVLRDVLRTLSENPAIEVLIGGHTDNVGSVAINDKLSHDRAKAVRDWLVDRGVSTARMQVEGYGASRPIVPNDTEGNRHKNRRIEFERIK
jgi:outer membrane protein OmpA-like peptidoglycan-associated protein